MGEEATGEELYTDARRTFGERDALSLRRARSIQARDDARVTPRTLLFAGPSADHPLAVDHDEEVTVDGARLVWTSGGVVRFRATFEEPAKQATWCRFPDERSKFASRERRRARRIAENRRALNKRGRGDGDSDDADSEDSSESSDSDDGNDASSPSFEWFRGAARAPTLCVRLRRSLFAHAPGGETRTAPLPRDALGDFAPCALGLLMRTRRGVFALRHPLDEPAPVTSVFGADGADALGRVAAAASPPATPSPAGVHRVVLRRLAVLPDARPGARVARAVARRAGHGGAPQRRGRAVRGAVRGGRLRRGGKRARRGDGRVRCSRRRRGTEHVPRPRRGGARLDRAGGLRVGSDVFRRRRARRRRARDTEALRPRGGRRTPRVRATEKEGRRSRIIPAPSRVRARERANRRRSQSHARAVA